MRGIWDKWVPYFLCSSDSASSITRLKPHGKGKTAKQPSILLGIRYFLHSYAAYPLRDQHHNLFDNRFGVLT